MKKLSALLCAAVLLLTLAACGKDAPAAEPAVSGDHHGAEVTVSDTGMWQYFNQMEYNLYQNIFYDETGKTGEEYLGKEIVKEGTFTVIRDQYNERDRYYVWGYLDATRCCDYQWEFVPKDPSALPAPGSAVVMTGTFTADDAALDGYWFTDAAVEVLETYDGPDYDFDTTAMSATLARVEVFNIERFPDYFGGKTLLLYGRALTTKSIQHPYYDESWSMDFESDKAPATGTYLLLGGEIAPSGETSFLKVNSYKEVD